MKRILISLIFAAALLPAVASASAPGLQVTPLLYEDILGDKAKNGSIDVANPTDAPVTIDVQVQGFRQVGSAGDMEFFDDPDLIEGIRTDLKTFDIGPRERVRVLFTVDPA